MLIVVVNQLLRINFIPRLRDRLYEPSLFPYRLPYIREHYGRR